MELTMRERKKLTMVKAQAYLRAVSTHTKMRDCDIPEESFCNECTNERVASKNQDGVHIVGVNSRQQKSQGLAFGIMGLGKPATERDEPMPQTYFTLEDDFLKEVMLGKREEAVAKLLEQVFNSVLQAQATEQLNAEPYERSNERTTYRNGSRTQTLATRVGSPLLHVPKFRDRTFSTDFFSSYQRSEQAPLLNLMEMVIQGVSTRKISDITETLCGTSFSKSTVSALCEQ